MRFRKLRIAVTALSLTGCVLLVFLWVRSYWWMDQAVITSWNTRILGGSIEGGFVVQFDSPPRLPPQIQSSKYYRRSTDLNKPGLAKRGFRFGGEIRIIPNGVCFPHWFVVVAIGTVAAAPWISWSNRFSLRALLIGTTLVAVGLGIIVAK